MSDPRPPSGANASVCPFVALAEDRDRRADGPDDGNRCYAERAPRRRDLTYQSDFCYSAEFATCSVFLAWAARNTAQPASVSEAASKAWASGIAVPEEASGSAETAREVGGEVEPLPPPTPEGGLFGPPDVAEAEGAGADAEVDWVSASAWAEAPWDERAELEADELEALKVEEDREEPEEELEAVAEEATRAPKVPAALPMRKRKPPLDPIRTSGSGEWIYADPPGREPLVSRRHGITPPILLAVLGLLVVSIVVFLVATQIGGGEGPQLAAASPSARPALAPATRAPVATAAPTADPSPTSQPKRRFYRVKAGDTLTGIASRFGVKPAHLQCLNGIRNRNIVQLGARYEIPPEGFTCPPNWRNATPAP